MAQNKSTQAPNVEVVEILGKDYKVVCEKDKADSLHQAAALINKQVADIRQASGKVQGNERVVVMAALNIAHELMNVSAGSVDLQAVHRMSHKLDAVIGRNADLGL